MDLETAAAIPEVWLTAWQLLTFVAKAESSPGNNSKYVLIHGGASGVGTAATQLATKILGYQVICTAGSLEKTKACLKFGAKYAINYKNENWVEEVEKITSGKGCAIILDCVGGGDYFTKNIRVAAVDCKWVLYGLLGGVKLPENDAKGPLIAQLLGKRINLLATLLNSRSDEYKAELVKNFTEHVVPKLASEDLLPVVDSVYSFEEVEKAHDYMETNANIGKILLKW